MTTHTESHESGLTCRLRRAAALRGFTLVQLLIVMAVLSTLAAIVIGSFGRGRATAMRTQCDMRLKTIAMALDAYKQEIGGFPDKLSKLRDVQILRKQEELRCPSDPLQESGGYGEFYVIRAPRDSGELPILVCPFHEKASNHGAQAFVGHYTKQFMVAPAILQEGNGAQVKHPDEAEPLAATVGMELHGGDRIITRRRGGATIRFADGSTAELTGGSDVTVLQSFVEGQGQAPLYTLVRQHIGDVVYRVHTGSKFDVATPTATAGAHGTVFRIVVENDGETKLLVTEGKVSLTSSKKTGFVRNNVWVAVTALGDILGDLLDLLL